MPPHFEPLSEEDRRTLLTLAREAILEMVCHGRFLDPPPAAGRLARPGGAFVTLTCDGRLRGCIGRMDSEQALAETVLQCAITAASQDPRFKPIGMEDAARLEIEISVVSEPRPIRPEELEPGVHGVIAMRGASRGLLLPQVAIERNWSATQFLEAACLKAGLKPDAWRDAETELFAFKAEVFSDASLAAGCEEIST